MNVNIDTKFITLIGDPLRQSFAARMQNAGYEAAGLNMLYFYTEADNEHLGDIVKGLRYMNFAGFAVTKPNKIKLSNYLAMPQITSRSTVPLRRRGGRGRRR